MRSVAAKSFIYIVVKEYILMSSLFYNSIYGQTQFIKSPFIHLFTLIALHKPLFQTASWKKTHGELHGSCVSSVEALRLEQGRKE